MRGALSSQTITMFEEKQYQSGLKGCVVIHVHMDINELIWIAACI